MIQYWYIISAYSISCDLKRLQKKQNYIITKISGYTVRPTLFKKMSNEQFKGENGD